MDVRTTIGEIDIAVGRMPLFASEVGVDEFALRLIVPVVWTDRVSWTAEEKTSEVRRRPIETAGA